MKQIYRNQCGHLRETAWKDYFHFHASLAWMSRAPKTRGRRNISRLFCLYTTHNACSLRKLSSISSMRFKKPEAAKVASGFWLSQSPWHFDPADRKCTWALGTRLGVTWRRELLAQWGCAETISANVLTRRMSLCTGMPEIESLDPLQLPGWRFVPINMRYYKQV